MSEGIRRKRLRSAALGVCLVLTLPCLARDNAGWMLQTNLLERSTAPVADLPNVLVLGDSISMGYTPFLKKRLADVANVSRPACNCGATQFFLRERGGMRDWVGTNDWRAIVVNCGIWDICYMKGDALDVDHFWGVDEELEKLPPLERGTAIRARGYRVRTPAPEYRANLRKILAYLKSTGAMVVFALTTPVPAYQYDDRCGLFRVYNELAAEVCAELGVETVDLYAVGERNYGHQPDKVHYDGVGNDALAAEIERTLRRVVKK